MHKIPIIIAPHQYGIKEKLDAIFVPLMISNLKISNPNTRIIYPNVNRDALKIDGVEDISCSLTGSVELDELERNYTHLSSNAKAFELFCIKRFFIIKQIMKQLNLETAFVVETDVFLFRDLNQIEFLKAPSNLHSIFLSEAKCISTSYLTYKFFEEYCSSVLSFYRSGDRLKKVKSWFVKYSEEGKKGGVCDMSFCEYMKSGSHGFPKWDIRDISSVNSCPDGDLHALDSFIGRKKHTGVHENFVMDTSPHDGKMVKKVNWVNGRPAASLEDGRVVLLDSIHFQGSAKLLMGIIFSNWISYNL